jgi:hypothetical protein
MAVKLNRPGYAFAQKLVGDGEVVLDERDDWSEHRPSAEQENAESRAAQYKHHDIELAAAHLHGMLDEARAAV